MTPEQAKIAALERKVEHILSMLGTLWPPRKRESGSDATGGNCEMVALTTAAGTGGDDATPCSYTYTFTTADGVTHTAITPAQNRLPQALAATFGLWKALTSQLVALDEWPDGGGC